MKIAGVKQQVIGIICGLSITDQPQHVMGQRLVRSDLPSGYTHLKYVGAIYNDSYANLEGMYQVDNDVTIKHENALIISNGNISSLSSYNIGAIIPDTVTSAHIGVEIHDDNTSEFRSSLSFFLDSNAIHTLAVTGTSEKNGQTYVNLLIIDTVRISPIINRTIYVAGSSSLGDYFTLYVRQYTHNNII